MRTIKLYGIALCLAALFHAAAGAMGTNGDGAGYYLVDPSYVFFDGAKLYEKPDIDSAKYVTAPAGTVLTRLRWAGRKIESKKGGLENVLEGVEPGGNTVYVRAGSIDHCSFRADLDGDGNKEVFLYGLDFEEYTPGAKSGAVKIVKDGRTIASASFEPMIYYDGDSIPIYYGYNISAAIISPKGFTPPLKLIKLSIHSGNESYPFGDAYFLWKAGKLTHCFTVLENYGPVHSLACRAVFPVEKNGKANSVILKESFDYGLDEEPKQGEGSYDRTIVYRWDGRSFRQVKDEKKFKKWVPHAPEQE